MIKKVVLSALKKRNIYVQRLSYLKKNVYSEIYDKQSLTNRRFVNVGSGDFYHPYWTNLDFVSDWYGPRQKHIVPFDLTENTPLPFEDDTLEIIYTSHTVEHVPFNSSMNLFKEAFRCLKKGGVLRVTTGPDADTDFRALKSKDKHWFYWGEETKNIAVDKEQRPLAEKWLQHVFTVLANGSASSGNKKYKEAEILNLIEEKGFPEILDWFETKVNFSPDRPQDHITWWNHERLQGAIRAAGFNNVYQSGFWQSVSPVMRRTPLFDTTHPQISIYVEAIK